MRLALYFLILTIITSFISCKSGGGTSSSGPTNVIIPSFHMSFFAGSTSDFESNNASWSQINNGVIETRNSAGMILTGAVNSDKIYSYRGHLTGVYTVSQIGIAFASENKTGNQIDFITDFGNGNKIITSIVLSSVNYVSAMNSANTATFNINTKVYSADMLVDTSSTDIATTDPSVWDSAHGYGFNSNLHRSSSGTIYSEINGAMGIGSHSYSMTASQATLWGLTGYASYKIQMKAGAVNSMALEINDIQQHQAQGYFQ